MLCQNLHSIDNVFFLFQTLFCLIVDSSENKHWSHRIIVCLFEFGYETSWNTVQSWHITHPWDGFWILEVASGFLTAGSSSDLKRCGHNHLQQLIHFSINLRELTFCKHFRTWRGIFFTMMKIILDTVLTVQPFKS